MQHEQPLPSLPSPLIEVIDQMIARADKFKVDPEFTNQIQDRRNGTPDFTLTDIQILWKLVVLIAYSNNANSERVTQLVEGQTFKSLFRKCFVNPTRDLSAKQILSASWNELRPIRFKYKVDAWTRCADGLRSIRDIYGSFMGYINHVGLPNQLRSESDIDVFWKGFDQIQRYFLQSRFPYFGRFTSLCHLLLHLGFDCVKPDLIVMKTAVELGVVPPPPKQRKNPQKIGQHPETSLKKTVQTIQRYSVHKGTRPAVIDLYFLIHGRQASSIGLVRPEYYQYALAKNMPYERPQQ